MDDSGPQTFHNFPHFSEKPAPGGVQPSTSSSSTPSVTMTTQASFTHTPVGVCGGRGGGLDLFSLPPQIAEPSWPVALATTFHSSSISPPGHVPPPSSPSRPPPVTQRCDRCQADAALRLSDV